MRSSSFLFAGREFAFRAEGAPFMTNDWRFDLFVNDLCAVTATCFRQQKIAAESKWNDMFKIERRRCSPAVDAFLDWRISVSHAAFYVRGD